METFARLVDVDLTRKYSDRVEKSKIISRLLLFLWSVMHITQWLCRTWFKQFIVCLILLTNFLFVLLFYLCRFMKLIYIFCCCVCLLSFSFMTTFYAVRAEQLIKYSLFPKVKTAPPHRIASHIAEGRWVDARVFGDSSLHRVSQLGGQSNKCLEYELHQQRIYRWPNRQTFAAPISSQFQSFCINSYLIFPNGFYCN